MSEERKVRFTKTHKEKLVEKANRYLEICNRIKALEDEKNKIKSEIMESLDRFGIEGFEYEDIKISTKEYIREGVDVQALKRDNADMFSKYARLTSSKRLDIRRKAVINE